MTFPKSRVQDLLTRRDVDWTDVLRIVEVGSTAHGISTPDTGDDLDLTVVRMEPFAELVTGSLKRQSMMIRTQPDGVRSRMGDIDLQVYTLRKFAGLARGGNPSILGAIFSQRVHHDSGHVDVDGLSGMVASKRAGEAFLGYMRQQIERWIGVRGQKNVTRPELVEAYGFDTKYAAHVIRLGHQGIEYMREGRFSMPMREDRALAIQGLRMGELSEYQALEWAKRIEDDLKQAITESELPDRPADRAVDAWLQDIYREWY
jgi:predicted nucleotidyltransferase